MTATPSSWDLQLYDQHKSKVTVKRTDVLYWDSLDVVEIHGGFLYVSNIVGSNIPSQWCFFVSEERGACDRSRIYPEEKRKPTIYQAA